MLEMEEQRKCRVFERQSCERSELSSYSPGWQRDSLCGCGGQPISFIQLEPWTLAHQTSVSESQRAKMLSLASGVGLVCWGPLTLHIILVFIIFSRKATALTQGLFVSVCLLFPSVAPTPPLLYWTHLALGFHLAEEYQCVNGSLFPLRLSLRFSFSQKGLLAQRGVCRPHENLCLYFLKRPLCTGYTFSQLILQLRCLVRNHLGMIEHPLAAETFSDSSVCVAVGVKVWPTWLSCCGWMDVN